MEKYNVGWGLTNLCNMNCEFCYSKQTRKETSELTITDWKKFIDENYDKIQTINYGTGENAILDEFFEFIQYVRTNYPEITQSLTTNGYLYERVKNNNKLYDIYKSSIDEVDVSLDFADKEKHNKFRGGRFVYDWAINTLKMLNKDEKKSTIVFVGFEETMKKENIDALFKIAKENNALLRLNIYRPVNKIKEVNNRYIVSYETLINTLEYIAENYSVISLNDVLIGNMYTDNKEVDNTGVNSIRILPNGDICPSTYLISDEYRNKYNIKTSNVMNKIDFPNFKEPPIPEECLKSNCSIVDVCKGGVYDRRLLWNNTLEKRDPYCPFENNDTDQKKKIITFKRERVSVHDGYLPTMFFKNKEN